MTAAALTRGVTAGAAPTVTLAGAALTIAVTAAAVNGHAWVVLLLLGGAGAALLAVRVGAFLSGVVVVIALSGTPGLLQTALGLQAGVTQVPTLLLLALATACVGRTQVPRVVALAGGVYVALCVGFLVVTLQSGVEYGLRGCLGLILAPAAFAVGQVAVLQARPGARTSGTRVVIAAVTVVAVLNVLLAFKQAFLGLTAAELGAARANDSTFLVGGQIRLMGAMRSNQDFALLAGCLAPAYLALTIRLRGGQRLVAGLVAAGLFGAVFLSLTRTALLAASLASIVVLLVGRERSTGHRVGWTSGVAVALVCTVTGAGLLLPGDRVQAALARASTLGYLGSDVSYQDRVTSTLPRAWAILTTHPFGLGGGAAGPVAQQLPGSAPFGLLTPDNGYLLIALQVGVLGAGAVLLALVVLAVRLCASGRSAGVGAAGGAVVVALLFGMALAGYWLLLGPMAILSVLVGAASAQQAAGAVSRRGPVAARAVRRLRVARS